MSKRSQPSSAPSTGAPPRPAGASPPVAGVTGIPDTDDVVVAEEWRRIEAERVAGEVSDAREDVAEAIANPPHHTPPGRGAGLWGALTAALVAGVLFALAVNLLMVSRRTETPSAGVPSGPRPPSESEKGPGIGLRGDDESDEPSEPDDAVDAAPPTNAPSPQPAATTGQP